MNKLRNFIVAASCAWAGAFASAAPNVEVLHINGINTTADKAFRSVKALQGMTQTSLARVFVDCPGLSYAFGKNAFAGAIYNPTGGSVIDSAAGEEIGIDWLTNFFADSIELTTSKMLEEQWLPQLQAATTYEELQQAAQAADATYAQESAAVRAVVEKGYQRIAAMIERGEKIVLTSHSQGATIANRIYLKLLLRYSASQLAQVQFLSFGSTANYQPPGESFTFSNDGAIGTALFEAGRFVPRQSCTDGCPFEALPDSGLADASSGWLHHDFIEAYLGRRPLGNTGLTVYNDHSVQMMERALRRLLAAECPYEDHSYTPGPYVGRYVSTPPGTVGELEIVVAPGGTLRIDTPETGSGRIEADGSIHFTAENPGRPGMTAQFTGVVEGGVMRGKWSGTLRLSMGDVAAAGTWEALLAHP